MAGTARGERSAVGVADCGAEGAAEDVAGSGGKCPALAGNGQLRGFICCPSGAIITCGLRWPQPGRGGSAAFVLGRSCILRIAPSGMFLLVEELVEELAEEFQTHGLESRVQVGRNDSMAPGAWQ